MRQATIHASSQYEIKSYGNGWAYLIVRQHDNRSCFMQDDDASYFRCYFEQCDTADDINELCSTFNDHMED